MTDRFKGLVVCFEQDIREDDAEGIINAISLLKGVSSVTGSIAQFDDLMNRERVRRELISKLYEVLK